MCLLSTVRGFALLFVVVISLIFLRTLLFPLLLTTSNEIELERGMASFQKVFLGSRYWL